MGRDHRDVLRRVEIPRTPGDVSFLMNDPRLSSSVVEKRLRELEAAGVVEVAPTGLWSQTERGRTQLRAVEAWEVVVEEVFEITARGQIAVGTIRSGVVQVNDWFRSEDGAVGRITSIEFTPQTDRTESVAFVADVKLSPGMVLRAHEPLAG